MTHCLAILTMLLAAVDPTPGHRVVIPAATDVSTRAVAQDFASIVHQITGTTVDVVDDTSNLQRGDIVVGHDNQHLAALGLAGFADSFTDGEYELRSVNGCLVIAGAPPRGTINGMYGYLQDHLGCRFFTPGVSRIPQRATLNFDIEPEHRKPAFRWRSVNPPLHWDAAWTARNRLNECKTHGGGSSHRMLMDDPRVATIGNYFSSHQFSYVPSALYDTHPEYYAMIGGQRVCAENANERAYCLTNDGFAAYMADMVKTGLEGKPADYRISITHADNGNYCQCPTCQADYEAHGVSGTYMDFANKVAAHVARDYPDVVIHTLAYGITFMPTDVKMHPNVRVIWCPISECYAHGFDACNANIARGTAAQMQQWIDNTDHLGVWYYMYQSDMLMPFPKLHATQHNLALFEQSGVDGVFVEDNPGDTKRTSTEPDGDKLLPAYGDAQRNGYFTVPFGLNHVRFYITARLLWDTDFDVEQGIRDFCATYYGPAGDEMARFVLLVESVDSYERTMGRSSLATYPGVHLSNSHAPLIKLSVIEQMDALFDDAEAIVADDATLLRRVRLARMTLQMAILSFAPADHPLRAKAFDAMFPLVETMGFVRVHRTGITYERMTFEQFKAAVADPYAITIPGMEPTGANLLHNSGFETEIDGDGIPDGWSASGQYLPEGFALMPDGVRVDGDVAHSGKRSARLSMSPTDGRIVALRQRFDVEPGASYRATMRYRSALSAGSLHLMYTAFDADGRWLRHETGKRARPDTAGEWVTLSCDVQAGEDTAQMMVEVLFYDDQAAGQAWIDNFECAMIER